MTITIAPHSAQPLTVNRLGYGTMRLPGPQVWGEPANRPQALALLRTAVDQGVNFLDTADYYGEDVTNRLIVEALHPYPADLVICTKVGAARRPDKSWVPFNRPENLRVSIENNLRTLRQEQIQLVHLRLMPGSTVPFEEQLGAMLALQQEGKILHVGLSTVSRTELEAGLRMGPIASVENMYGYGQQDSPQGDEVLTLCEAQEIAFIPYFSLVNSQSNAHQRLAELARQRQVTEVQLNLAWLLHRSPWLLPIPGTSSRAHLLENLQAGSISLSAEDMAYLK